ncbi:hypothetical protein ABZ891_23205 [Streptomyces sp. NPDC047023]
MAVHLLDWLEEHHLTLAIRSRTGLERWMTSDDGRHRWGTGHLVR